MQVRVKLFASLSHLLPDGVKPHEGMVLELPEATTPQALIEQLRIPEGMAHLVLQNGAFIPVSARSQPVLVDGDVFAVWPPVAGG